MDMQLDVDLTSPDVDIAAVELTSASPLDSVSVDLPPFNFLKEMHLLQILFEL